MYESDVHQMKKTYLLIFSCFLFFGSNSQTNHQLVNEFIESYNDKDSLRTFNLLHDDFIELWEKDTVINNKTDYSKNYAWGKVMNDLEVIEIIKMDSNFVETISTYYSDRDRLLDISPYKSKRVYELKNGKILKVTGGKFDGYEEYDSPRREKYAAFFTWLSKNHNLEPSDFAFDKNGAEKLKKKIIEYTRK